MSWLFSAATSIGPVVGSDSTTETIAEPEITCGRRLPMSAMNGLSAMRSGYLTSSRNGAQPLGAAGDDVLLLQLVEQVRAQPADHRRRCPTVPITITGIHRCARIEPILPSVQGWLTYCGSISPPTDVPNQILAR